MSRESQRNSGLACDVTCAFGAAPLWPIFGGERRSRSGNSEENRQWLYKGKRNATGTHLFTQSSREVFPQPTGGKDGPISAETGRRAVNARVNPGLQLETL